MNDFVLVCGGSGQVGQELVRQVWPSGLTPVFPSSAELDLRNPAAISEYFEARQRSLVAVVNCAAFTGVDKAEVDVGEAFLINAQGPAWLAVASRAHGIPLIQVSTDYVFDGESDRYYTENDPVGPLGAYGASKLAGELAVSCANPRSVILRTAWVVSPFGSNFIKTMLRLGADRPELRVVDDQRGCPTSAGDIARAIIAICERLVWDQDYPYGRLHFVNAGEATWYELAQEIFRISAMRGGPNPKVTAIPTSEYPTPARRPRNSRLDSSRIRTELGMTPRDWRTAVADIVTELLTTAS